MYIPSLVWFSSLFHSMSHSNSSHWGPLQIFLQFLFLCLFKHCICIYIYICIKFFLRLYISQYNLILPASCMYVRDRCTSIWVYRTPRKWIRQLLRRWFTSTNTMASIILHHIIWRHIIWRHIKSYCIISYHIISYCIISRHLMSHSVTEVTSTHFFHFGT